MKVLARYPTKDKHNKRVLSAFFNWCTDMGKLPNRFDFRKLKTQAKPKEKSEDIDCLIFSFTQNKKGRDFRP